LGSVVVTHQHVDGERHYHEGDQQVGQRQADDKVIGDGLQGPFPAHADYDQHVAEQREYREHDQPERPIVLDDRDAGGLVVATGQVVEHGRRRRGVRGTVVAPVVLVRVVAAKIGAGAVAVHRRRRGRSLGHRRSGRGRRPVSEQLARGRSVRGRRQQAPPPPQQQQYNRVTWPPARTAADTPPDDGGRRASDARRSSSEEARARTGRRKEIATNDPRKPVNTPLHRRHRNSTVPNDDDDNIIIIYIYIYSE